MKVGMIGLGPMGRGIEKSQKTTQKKSKKQKQIQKLIKIQEMLSSKPKSQKTIVGVLKPN